MKKLLITFICYNLLVMPAFCMISDSLVEETLDSSKPYPEAKVVNITDEFAEQSLNNYKPTIIRTRIIIIDSFAENNQAKNEPLLEKVDLHEFIPKHTGKDYANYKKSVIADRSNLKQIEIRIYRDLTTQDHSIDEGDYINFETVKPVKIGNKTYPKGTVVRARIETISQNKTHGVPADIVIGDFSIDNHKLIGEISKTGANRSLWVYPASYVGTCFFGLGAFLLFIRGGHAKIKTTEHFILQSEN